MSPTPTDAPDALPPPWMAFERHGGPGKGAVLVFASSERQALRLAWPVVSGWVECDYIDLRVRRIRERVEYLRSIAKLAAPHVVDAPPSCRSCERWGEPLDASGRCPACGDGEDA